jgi:PEP-CTERM putative exosortase interaction domain
MKTPVFLRTSLAAGTLGSLGLAFASSASAVTLLDETFAPDQRLVQNLPTTAAWYMSSASNVSDSTGALVSASNRHAVAYFTDAGSPLTLDIGDKLEVSFTFSVIPPAEGTSTILRLGLLNSGGNRVTGDNSNFENAIFDNYVGYGTFLNHATASAGSIRERNGGISGKLINGADAWTTTANNVGTGAAFVANQSYSASLTLSRSVSGVTISFSVAGLPGYSFSHTDGDTPFTTFDTFVFFGSPSVGGYTLDDVVITYTPVPEPSSAAASAGLAVIGCALLRRRRSR